MGKIVYQREHAENLWPEIRPLLELHWREIATYQDIPLAPDHARYNHMELHDALRCYTARERHATFNLLVGYAVFSVAANMHYRTSRIAVQDVVFVLPDYRNSRAGVGLTRYADAELKREGMQVVYHHVKVAHPALGRILARRGYEHVENIWAKRLDTGD